MWSPNTLVGPYPTFSPLPVPEGHRRFKFLKHCLSPLRAPPLSESSVPCAVRTFLTPASWSAVEHLECQRYRSIPSHLDHQAGFSSTHFNCSRLALFRIWKAPPCTPSYRPLQLPQCEQQHRLFGGPLFGQDGLHSRRQFAFQHLKTNSQEPRPGSP